jgi:hypothetical protein
MKAAATVLSHTVPQGPDRPNVECDALERTLSSAGPAAALEQLIDHLNHARDYRPLLEALLLKARHELGLPPIQVGALASLPEPVRTQYEERYVAAIRVVGEKLLAAGEIASAWSYFRAIAEPEPVAAALDRYQPDADAEILAQIIDVAFNQGANPRRGFELILDHYGTCSAITALEGGSISDGPTQVACIERLIRHLHSQLAANVRADIVQRGHPTPDPAASIAAMVAEHEWIFADEAYHIDISHLSSTVRYSIMVSDASVLTLAVDLAEYGRRLSPRLQYEGAPPFERTFDDHRIFLRALLGQEVETAIAHFEKKVEESPVDDLESSLPAQVLVNLLVRLGKLDQAIEVASARLVSFPESALSCPGLAELCQRAGRPDLLAAIARRQGNLVHYLAARLDRPEESRP